MRILILDPEKNTSHRDEFDQYNLVYKHSLFNKEHIRKYLSKGYSSYYLRINWLFKYFKSFITS